MATYNLTPITGGVTVIENGGTAYTRPLGYDTLADRGDSVMLEQRPASGGVWGRRIYLTDSLTVSGSLFSGTSAQMLTLLQTTFAANSGNGGTGTATTDASALTTGTLDNARLTTGAKSKAFDYLITKASTTYFAFDKNGDTAFSGTNASNVINSTIAALATGGTIAISKADYNIPTSIIDAGNSNVNLVFAKGAKFIAGAALDKPVIYLTSVSHWRIYNAEINGNASAQTAPQVSGAPTIIPDGIGASTCNDVIIYDAYIHDVRRFGVNFDESSTSSGVINSYVTLCGWNGINLGNHTTDLDLFALNNDVSFCGDVGIAHYGVGCRTTGNSIHDISGTSGSNGQGYGITIEGGGNNQLADNRISNCKGVGIYGITAFENNKITGNKIDQWDGGQTSAPAIHMFSEYNLIANNVLNSTRTIGMGIKLENATNNSVKNNFITCPRPIWLQTNANNNHIFGNTTKSTPAPIHIEDSTCTGNKIDYNDLTASSASIEDAGIGTIIGFNYYSGGSLHVPTIALPTGSTAITQAAGDNSTKVATTAYADRKQNIVTLSTTGTSGAATFNQSTGALNIPNYAAGGGGGTTSTTDEAFPLALQAMGSTIKAMTIGMTFSQATTGLALTDGIIYDVPVYLRDDATVTGVKVILSVSGVFTGDNENRVGLTSVSAGTHTLVASSVNNLTLWSSAVGLLTIPFSAPIALTKGLYFINILYNSSAQTTAPSIFASGNYNNTVWSALATDLTNSNRLYGSRSSSTLLASYAASTLAQPSSNIPLAMLY